jgi:hypothetical protein
MKIMIVLKNKKKKLRTEINGKCYDVCGADENI